ncbi:TetR/AcrR family transcriptional regulator [Vibrio sp. S4M6]|uniref:TetR/AcrR family transcriptional regulator n=1 Tax=Vibrio sinus TaxID=2946865 RepID=UPI00202A3CBC|nr:TetR/AcrR family transcriptional regulator [Vibrio sinus]MCL9783837.1 TetR/AcrR family transcriptional regulator [Vibrio sinus]
MKTKDKIVQAALELFNENGERSITTNHIAAHIGISPGNLYYHFRNKQELIREIFKLYSKELLEWFAPVKGNTEGLAVLKHYLNAIFTLMWKYRFFYSNLPDILRRDEQLHSEYIEVQHKLKVNLVEIIQLFVDLRLLSIQQDDIENFVTTLHMIVCGWLSYQSAMSSNITVTESIIHRGMLQMIYVVKPRATELGQRQLQLLEEGVTAMYI